MAEIRVEVPDEELAVIDGYCSAHSVGRTDVVRKLLRQFSESELHAAIKVCRAAGINPMASESDRSTSARGRK